MQLSSDLRPVVPPGRAQTALLRWVRACTASAHERRASSPRDPYAHSQRSRARQGLQRLLLDRLPSHGVDSGAARRFEQHRAIGLLLLDIRTVLFLGFVC
jgi:hypothetical protein